MPTVADDSAWINQGLTKMISERRARQSEYIASSNEAAHDGRISPAENERLSAAAYQQSFADSGRMTIGVVVFSSPYTNWYRVLLSDGNTDMPCTALSETSLHPLSIKPSSIIAPRTSVLVYVPKGSICGYIVGCLPYIVSNASAKFPDWVSQGSNGGFRRELYYRGFPHLFAFNGGQLDFSDGRPPDTSSIGEWSRFNDLGGGLFMDPFMTFMRVDEGCGLWMFYMDRLARLCAHNYDFRSAVSEQMIRADVGEALNYFGSTPYAWEALGSFQPTAGVFREISDDDVHYKAPYGKYEPLVDDQQPFYRYEEFKDYLGQGYMRQLQVPPQSSATPYAYSQDRAGVGVFREQLGLDGSWSLTSAHSISLCKRILVPIAKRKLLTEDPKGDDATAGNYRFAGLAANSTDDSTEHKVVASLPLTGNPSNLLTAAALLDFAAYQLNWKALHPFHYHKKDYLTPEEVELTPSNVLQQPIQFNSLSEKQWLEAPTPVKVKIDHRYGDTDYYETQAGVFLLPDGGIVMRDGYGSELKMTGGSVEITAPGDIWVKSGRSVINYAGDDMIIKARSSVDVSATEHDVRLKAERHLECLAGNGGKVGRLLLDCQASGSVHSVDGLQGEEVEQTGLILKSAKSDIIALGSNIYLRTGGGDVGSGEIILDAAKGAAQIQFVGSAISFFSEIAVNMIFPIEDPQTTHQFSQQACYLDSSVIMKGGVTIQENGIVVSGNIDCVNGIIASDGNAPFDFKLGDLSSDSPAASNAREQVLDSIALAQSNSAGINNDGASNALFNAWYEDGRPGSDDVIENTAFAPRTEEQMRTKDFLLPECYFQQLISAAGGGRLWEESDIKYQGLKLQPHPGRSNWVDKETFATIQLQLYNPATGRDADRGDAYENPKPLEWDKKTPNDYYRVTT